ncbi:MAG: tetratricopeptide repeat protein [Lysinibacillus sp.]
MKIKPKFSLAVQQQSPTRTFTNREGYLQSFKEKVDSKEKDQYSVLVFYGIGGIGKSRLRQKLCSILDEEYSSSIYSTLDFDNPAYKETETAIFWLRKCLSKKYKISFPMFDIAYSIYWSKIHPEIPMNKETFPLLEESGIVTDMISILGDVPIIGIAPKIFSFVVKTKKSVGDYLKSVQNELYQLENFDAKDILERLPMYFALDFKQHLNNTESPAVIFLDTYEALWDQAKNEAHYLLADSWIQELVAQLPEVLWVITGREVLRWPEMNPDWENYITHYQLAGLADNDARNFLASCNINDATIQTAIIQGSSGVPYYLDLSVDTYYEVKSFQQREPLPTDFANNPKEIFFRFIRYLNVTEIETLKLLSAPRYWHYDLFKSLVSEFGTGYPLTSFNELCRFSFIQQDNSNEQVTMHGLMRESLQEHQNIALNQKVHTFIFNYYNQSLNKMNEQKISEADKNNFLECFYHASICLNTDDFVEWFYENTKIFYKAGYWRFLISLYESVLPMIENSIGDGDGHMQYALMLHDLGEVFRRQGKYDEAISTLNRALTITKQAVGERDVRYADTLRTFAVVIHRREGRFEEAESLFQQSLHIQESSYGRNHLEIAQTLYDIGSFYRYQFNYQEAKPYFKEALTIRENLLAADHSLIGKSLKSYSFVCQKLGEYEIAQTLYDKAIDVLEKSLGLEHPTTAMTLNNYGSFLFELKRYEESENVYLQAISIKEKCIGKKHPYYAKSLHELGALYCETNRFYEGEKLLETAFNIRLQTLGETNPRTKDSEKLYLYAKNQTNQATNRNEG